MKILQKDGEWLEVPDDDSVRYSKEDVMEECEVSARMLTSLYKRGIIAPKCFESEKKHWYSAEDMEAIKNAPPPEQKPRKKAKKAEHEKMTVTEQVAQQPIVITQVDQELNATLLEAIEHMKAFESRLEAVENSLENHKKLASEFMMKAIKKFQQAGL